MGASSTRENCRECGKETLHRVASKVPGFIIYRVVCPECQVALDKISGDQREQR